MIFSKLFMSESTQSNTIISVSDDNILTNSQLYLPTLKTFSYFNISIAHLNISSIKNVYIYKDKIFLSYQQASDNTHLSLVMIERTADGSTFTNLAVGSATQLV